MKNQKSYTPKKSRYKNDLPHWQWENAIYFVTFRLHGSLPKSAIQILKDEQELQRKKLIKKGLPEHEIKTALKKMHHLYFGKFDHLLDNSNSPLLCLKTKRIEGATSRASNGVFMLSVCSQS